MEKVDFCSSGLCNWVAVLPFAVLSGLFISVTSAAFFDAKKKLVLCRPQTH